MGRTGEKQRDIFKIITCPGCGGRFKQIPGVYGHYRCKDCGAYEAYELNGEVYFVDRFGDMDEEDTYADAGLIDDIPEVCKNCDNNCYPDCRDSCGLFDD